MSEPFLAVVPPLPPQAWWRPRQATMPFPLDDHARLHGRARQGLYQALRAAGLGPGDVAVLPAYHHGSEVEAYIRAGLTPRFYDTGAGIAPPPESLDDLLSPEVRVVHLIHYLGLAQPVDAWRTWADRHRLLLVEDTAQGWLGHDAGRPLGSTGDIALFSVYKAVGVPDGGATVARGTRLEPRGASRRDAGALARRHLAWLSGRSGMLGAMRARRTGNRPYDPARDFELGDPDQAAGRSTTGLLRRLATPAVADARRRHYRYLLDALEPWVPDPFRRDPGEASPFAFPVQAEDKAGRIHRLRVSGIGAVDAWSVAHPSLPPSEHPGADRWRRGIILLPVHQELREVDVERVAAVARRVLSEGA